MKSRSRLTALLLALMLLLSLSPTAALADAIQTVEDYQSAVQRVKDEMSKPSVPQEQENSFVLTRTAQVQSIVRGENAGTVEQAGSYALPLTGRLTLTAPAADGYQWQIKVGDVWANIVEDNGPSITLTYAKVQTALTANAAQVRCVLLNGGQLTASAEVTVTVDSTVTTETKNVEQTIPVTSFYGDAVKNPVQALNAAVMADEGTPTTYAIVINYVFADGTQAAPSWTATVATGTTYTQEVKSPVVLGYTPDKESVSVNASEETTYTVTYKPAEVNYTVRHYQQNVDNDNYTLVDTVTRTGYTKSAVGEGLAKTYDGFTALLYDTTTEIAADGSTVVELYYDRNYYLMNFDLDGGYGVEPIYARYEAKIDIGEPTKAGYTFNGWKPTIPATMPINGGTYKANWTTGTASFTVVYWYENADDEDYSYVADRKIDNIKPGSEVKSETYKDYSFTGRDNAHFTYNADKAETVTVSGDGSTVLNVYYTRNTYTLTFTDGTERVLTCGKEEHTHTYTGSYKKGGIIGMGARTYYYGGCYPAGSNGSGGATKGNEICGKEEHTHSNGGLGSSSCYSNQPKVVATITAKYGADIHGNFPIKDGNETIWWTVPNGCESFEPGNYLGSIDTMPGENITFSKQGSQSGAKIYYYVETLKGDSGDTTHGGKNYKQYKVIDLDTGYKLTYAEEFHPIKGFTQGDSNPKLPVGGSVRMNENNYLYYTRNSYDLKFYNHNAYVDGKGGSVQYEAPLKDYYFEPDYPAGLEPNAYVFAGWYTTAGCYAGSEADLNTMTMPASDLMLYAKWTPKTHTVKTYLTDKMDTPVNVGDTGSNVQTVEHGKQAVKPNDPINGNYDFVGWFYKDENGTEKAFDFSMPVNRDLELYAKWSSNKLVEYTIKYTLEDGTTVIAAETTGSALAGTTKTFDAKTGTALNEGYQSGYFPKTASHSLTMDIEGTEENKKNEFTFVYVPKAEVNYTVRYLEKDTNVVLHEEKHAATPDAVITEKFEQVTGYAPDAYQKRLVLSAEESKNVITFWYVKDNEHAPVQIIHWTQNIAGDGYTEYQSSTDLNGVINKTYTENPLTIAGFTYNKTKSNASGTLTAEGLVLNLYYDRIEYPYEFRFLEQGTENKLADPVTGKARYEAQVTQMAKTIPGYKLVEGVSENQAITIAIEDPAETASKNVKTFYYVEDAVDIKYQVVGPTGSGKLDNYQDNGIGVLTGKITGTEEALKGSAPTVAENFKFVGWFKDEACTQPVETDWVAADNKLTPGKTRNYGTVEAPVMGYEAATYYAKFEYNLTTLTITKSGMEGIDEGQSFLLKVEGYGLPSEGLTIAINGNRSETISGLTVGQTYTVTEISTWSWRYSADAQTITLQATGNNVTMVNSRVKNKWLDGDSYVQNVFGN